MLWLYDLLRVVILFYFLSLLVRVLGLLAGLLWFLCEVLLVIPLYFLNVGNVAGLYRLLLGYFRAFLARIVYLFLRYEFLSLRLRSLATLFVRL